MTPRRGTETRQRTTMVALRLHPDEYKTLADAARDRSVSLSELLRGSALRALTTGPDDRESAADDSCRGADTNPTSVTTGRRLAVAPYRSNAGRQVP